VALGEKTSEGHVLSQRKVVKTNGSHNTMSDIAKYLNEIYVSLTCEHFCPVEYVDRILVEYADAIQACCAGNVRPQVLVRWIYLEWRTTL
jgi:hypothetical protein